MENAPDLNQRYTYADYMKWPEDFRCELIDGEIVMLAAPLPSHQAVSAVIHAELMKSLQGRPCAAFAAPFDVPLDVPKAGKDGAKTVVQPDIAVLCKGNQLPSLVAEILSASTAIHDLNRKKELYRSAGIPEYWVVSYERRMITRFSLEGGAYAEADFKAGELNSLALGVKLDVDALFASVDAAMKILE